jgi:hypothetical protein
MTIQPFPENDQPFPDPSSTVAARVRVAPDLFSAVSRSNIAVGRLGVGITGIILRPGARITGDDGARMCAEYLELTGGKPGSVLLQITGVGSVSREAVSVDGKAANVTALAVLGSTPVDRVIAHRFLALTTPGCPNKYFTDEEAAIAWLRTVG